MNRYYLDKADKNMPKLRATEVLPVGFVSVVPDTAAFFGCRAEPAADRGEVFRTGDTFTLDLGTHCVGYLSFRLCHETQFLDAPVRLRLRFAETPYELFRDNASYHGGLCASWLQEDIFNIDDPGTVSLPRRYCFRYLEVTVIASPRPVRLTDFSCRCVSAADPGKLKPLPEGTEPELIAIDRVAAKTLADCMQTAYEDGPKRDRRLWTGDLRLQALTDYYLYGNDTLVRRCLYLFAACEEDHKYLPGCLFQKPSVFYDDGMGISDYALLYTAALCDYFEHTHDAETARDLFPTAMRQTDLAVSLLDENGVITFLDGWFAFIDWAPDIQRTIPVEGVFLYALEKMAALADALGETACAARWKQVLTETRKAAYRAFYDAERGAFRSAVDRDQYSVQAQAWMILGGVIGGEAGKAVLTQSLTSPDALKPVTPYMHHYVVEAMMKLGMREEALAYVKDYWGGMVKAGADTFWEVYVPSDPECSPYGDRLMNSFCHAWSCSASYFIRKYFVD